jgi:hypothetical protein
MTPWYACVGCNRCFVSGIPLTILRNGIPLERLDNIKAHFNPDGTPGHVGAGLWPV